MWRRVTTSWIVVAVGAGVGASIGAFLLKRLFKTFDSTLFASLRRSLEGNRKLEFVGRVSRICLYPVKACNGVYVEDAYVGRWAANE